MKKFWKSKTIWNNLIALAALAYQSQAGYFAPIETQAVLLAVSNIFLRGVTGQPIDWSQIKLPGGKLPAAVLLFALGFGSIFLSGCSALKVVDERPVLSEFAVRVAVSRVLTEHPGWAQPAQEISASALRLVNESTQVALPELSAYVASQIPWDEISVADAALLQMLITAIGNEIQAGLTAPQLATPQVIQVRVATVLGWIHQVAELHALRSAAIEWPTVAPSVASTIDWQDAGPLAAAAIEQAAAAADRKFGL